MPNQLARRTRGIAVALAALAVSSSLANADVFDTTWLGGTGSWNDPTKWSGGVVPNNVGSTTFRVAVPSGSITVTSSKTLDALTISNGASVITTGNFHMVWNISGATQIDGLLQFVAGSLNLGANPTLAGSGTVSILDGQLANGSIIPASGIFTIGPTMTVNVHSGIGTIGKVGQPLVNYGRIIAGSHISNGSSFNSESLAGSPIKNFGTIHASDSLGLKGEYTTADLGSLSGGAFEIRGTLQNAGQTLHIDGATQWWINNGTISGGTVSTSGAGVLSTHYLTSATFNNVTLNGRMFLGGATRFYLSDGHLVGDGEVAMSSDNGAPEGPARIYSSSFAGGSVTIGAGILVHGGAFGTGAGPGIGGSQSAQRLSLVRNHGTLRTDASPSWWVSNFTINAGDTINDGTLGIVRTGNMYVSGNVTFALGGVLELELSDITAAGLLQLTGRLDLTTSGDALALSAGAGTLPGTFYRIATTGTGVIGQFDSVTPGFEVMYTNTEIFARLVPEPAAAAIGVAAMSVLGLRRRRT